MSNAARKQRKRAGARFEKAMKKPTRPYATRIEGLGLVSRHEILASILVRGLIR